MGQEERLLLFLMSCVQRTGQYSLTAQPPRSPLRAAIFHSPAGSHIQPSTQLGSELVMCDFWSP